MDLQDGRRQPLASTATLGRKALTVLALVLLGLAGLAGGLASAASIPDVEWQLLPDGPDRALHAMVYDAANQMLWSFGGIEADATSNDFRNSVYRLDLQNPDALWERMPISGLQPPPLAFHTAIYDPLRQRMVVYGGLLDRNGFSSQRPADGNTVWFLDLSNPDDPTWSRESVPGNGTDRFAHAAVYVPELDAMIVSGGLSTFSNARSDNYALLLGEEPMRWVRLANAGFNYRAGHALLHDADGQRLLAYGGLSDLNNVKTLSDIVALDLSQGLDGANQWLRVTPATPSLARAFMATAFDPDRRLWWVHGGLVDNNRFLRDLSVLDLNTAKPEWTRTQVVYNGPLDRFAHTAVWDEPRQRMIVQGGTPDNNVTLRDTRALVYLDVGAPTATATVSDTPMSTATTAVSDTPTATAMATGTTTTATATGTTTTATATATTLASPTPTLDNPTNTPTATTPVNEVLVVIESFAFDPDPVRVPLGATVRWENRDAVPHTSTSGPPGAPDGRWESGFLNQGDSFSQTFTSVGTFAYFCRVHPNMTGTVIVFDPAATTPTSTTSPGPSATADAPTPTPPDSATVWLPMLLNGAGSQSPTAPPPNTPTPTSPAPPPTSAAPSAEIVGQLGGEMHAVAATGSFAFVGAGPRLVVLDISNAAQPAVVWQSEILPGLVLDVALDGTRAYVASNVLTILDISNPRQPQVLASDVNAGGPRALVVSDDRVYVGSGNGLRVLDVSDPARPVQIGFLSSSFTYSVAKVGDVVYMGGYNRFTVADVSDPANPTEVAQLTDTSSVHGLTAAGELAYLGTFGDGLRILNVADPTSPTLVGELETADTVTAVALAGGRAYLAVGNGELLIADVTDPTQPAALGTFAPGGDDANDVALVGDEAFLVSSIGGLSVANVSDPAAPAALGAYFSAGGGPAVVADGNTVYFGHWTGGVEIVDVSQPTEPGTLSFTEPLFSAAGIDVAGNRLYVVDGYGDNLHVFDVSNPAQPQALGKVSGVDAGQDVAVVGDRAYVAEFAGGLWVGDVSNPASPVQLGHLDGQGRGRAVAVGEGHAFVASDTGGTQIVGVTDPTAPVRVSTVDQPADANAVAVTGARAVIVGNDPHLQVWDVSDPANPAAGGSLAGSRTANAVALQAGLAYVAHSSGLWLVDVTDASSPRQIADFRLGASYDGVAVAGDLVYLVGNIGLEIVRVRLP